MLEGLPNYVDIMASQFNFARWYEPLFGSILNVVRARALQVAPPERGMKVLDIGCGTGVQLAIYQEKECEVFGLDLSEPMLKVARENLGSKAILTNGDATRMPYPERTFDLVMSSLFLHQLRVEVRSAALREVMRVLQPEGRILLVDFHPGAIDTLGERLTKFGISSIEFAAGWEHFSNSRDFLKRGGIPELAESHRLKGLEMCIVANGNIGIYLLQQS
jgi:ubiquinone/menaquinone biosynthesis C-methylase UbiE